VEKVCIFVPNSTDEWYFSFIGLESELLEGAVKSLQNVEEFSKDVQTAGVPLP
jgi:hypothetical protein